MGGIRDLSQMRHRGSPRLMVIQAASGAGKSSFLRAGLWPKLARTAEFVPLAIVRPAKGVITGPAGSRQGPGGLVRPASHSGAPPARSTPS
jgi:hypothetical protein